MVQVLEETPSIRSHEEFDAHHRQWCLRLMDFYTHHGVALTHGQAQKWINMTAKYLLVLNDARVGDLVRFLHVPIDNVIAKQAEAELQVERPKSRWSKLDTDGYEYYQRGLREALSLQNATVSPIEWEIQAWLDGMSARLGVPRSHEDE